MRGASAGECTRRIKDRARRLGFDLVGVSPVGAPRHAGSFAEWLRRGLHGEMAYMARTAGQRMHPGEFLPWARSIISVGMGYATPHPPGVPPGDPRGWISRYAWGDDYHDVLQERLDGLLAAVRELAPGAQGRAYVDAGPVLERDAAARAGLGWIGKNTLLLHPARGSWFFLGELFLDLVLEYDRPLRDRCGRCDLCLKACPTGAFLGPYVLDARRCISYLTIELKGAIPRELRPLVGAHVFGCDICQDVCPYNAKNKAFAAEPAFDPRPGLRAPELIPLLGLTEAEFRRRFAGSPLTRPKRRGFLRNVCVALGNLKDPQAVPALARALREDAEPLVRGHAAWALGRIGTPEALQALEEASRREADAAVRSELAEALAMAVAGPVAP
ncbi:MAG TPA: tRNA epoxyqueuosine(34) reductase QueG [Candidatus Sulfotelmatobacter sp.]|nr:tRNA epoxyqueuosine(34) reductase QueG [Candidatus Sulfotelmatobacter sp.]